MVKNDEEALSPPSVVDDQALAPPPPPPPPQQQQLLVIATRIHRGESSTTTTISTEDANHIAHQIQQFCRFCQESHHDINHHDNNNNNNNIRTTIVRGIIAVDVTPNTDLLTIVRAAVLIESTIPEERVLPVVVVVEIHVIPVQPWGRFTPALNALLSDAAQTYRRLVDDQRGVVVVVGGAILYCSLETTTTTSSSSSRAVRTLLSHMDYETTLVCGAVLPGHDHITTSTTTTTTTMAPTTTILNGRTSPWNTFAMWNIEKLARIGFVTVSEGWIVDRTYHDDTTATTKSIAGIEEVATIALLQQLFHPHTQVMAKLISIVVSENTDAKEKDAVQWDTSTTDPARQQWHEYKMQSKLSRARAQLRLLALLPDNENDDDTIADPKPEPRLESSTRPGIVYHY